jgi:hypothetical protein
MPIFQFAEAKLARLRVLVPRCLSPLVTEGSGPQRDRNQRLPIPERGHSRWLEPSLRGESRFSRTYRSPQTIHRGSPTRERAISAERGLSSQTFSTPPINDPAPAQKSSPESWYFLRRVEHPFSTCVRALDPDEPLHRRSLGLLLQGRFGSLSGVGRHRNMSPYGDG